MSHERFSLATAKQALREDQLLEWIRDYLTEGPTPNHGLWDRIQMSHGTWIGPVEVRHDLLRRCFGSLTEKATLNYIVDGEPDHIWEEKINWIMSDSSAVLTWAPLIVRYTENVFAITDGGHRHEAIGRLGLPTCWALIEMRTECLGG